MSNPFLNDKAIAAASQAGWAAPEPSTQVLGPARTPIDDGPISSWRPQVMTVSGTITATGVLLVLLIASATAGWMATDDLGDGRVALPVLAIGGILVGFVCAIVVHFKPLWSKVLAPVYAIAEGFFLGAISKAYNETYDGDRHPGRRRHARRVLRDARALPHRHHQGHRQVPPHDHHGDARSDGVLPGVVRAQPVRRRDRHLPVGEPARHRLQPLRRDARRARTSRSTSTSSKRVPSRRCRRAWSGSQRSVCSSPSCGCTSSCSAC